MTTYIGIIHKDDRTDYGVCFPDFPGCISAGSTPEELQRMAEEALRFHLEGLMEDGIAIPSPMSLEEVKTHAFAKQASAFLFIKAPAPTTPVRVNITLDRHLLHEIDQVASNRSAFLAQAARNELTRHHL